MASLYKRPRSPFWWIKYRSPDGVRVQESTNLRFESPLETRKAETLLADKKLAERMLNKSGVAKGEWSTWVEPWLKACYKDSPDTHQRIFNYWQQLRAFFSSKGVKVPLQVSRGLCYEFAEWREHYSPRKGAPATIVNELKALAMIMDEAHRRGLTVEPINPARKLGLSKKPLRRKPEITKDEEALIIAALADPLEIIPFEAEARSSWMLTAFTVAIKQGCRLKETSFDLYDQVDLNKRQITFHAKGGKTFTTSLHTDLVPLIERLRGEGRRRSWEWFGNSSRDFTRFFRKIGMRHICFHCTRVSAITRCARAGVPLSQALRYFGHASTAVHESYQRLSADDVGSCIDAL